MQLTGTFDNTEKDNIDNLEFSAFNEEEEHDKNINTNNTKAEFNINITEEIDIDEI
jgi:hypothetical protein